VSYEKNKKVSLFTKHRVYSAKISEENRSALERSAREQDKQTENNKC